MNIMVRKLKIINHIWLYLKEAFNKNNRKYIFIRLVNITFFNCKKFFLNIGSILKNLLKFFLKRKTRDLINNKINYLLFLLGKKDFSVRCYLKRNISLLDFFYNLNEQKIN